MDRDQLTVAKAFHSFVLNITINDHRQFCNNKNVTAWHTAATVIVEEFIFRKLPQQKNYRSKGLLE